MSRMSSNFRIGVLLAACVIALAGAVAAGTVMIAATTHGPLPAWYITVWVVVALTLTLAGGMFAYHEEWRPEQLMMGALLGGVVGIIAGIMWPVIIWLIIAVGAIGLWVAPWSRRGY